MKTLIDKNLAFVFLSALLIGCASIPKGNSNEDFERVSSLPFEASMEAVQSTFGKPSQVFSGADSSESTFVYYTSAQDGAKRQRFLFEFKNSRLVGKVFSPLETENISTIDAFKKSFPSIVLNEDSASNCATHYPHGSGVYRTDDGKLNVRTFVNSDRIQSIGWLQSSPDRNSASLEKRCLN